MKDGKEGGAGPGVFAARRVGIIARGAYERLDKFAASRVRIAY